MSGADMMTDADLESIRAYAHAIVSQLAGIGSTGKVDFNIITRNALWIEAVCERLQKEGTDAPADVH